MYKTELAPKKQEICGGLYKVYVSLPLVANQIKLNCSIAYSVKLKAFVMKEDFSYFDEACVCTLVYTWVAVVLLKHQHIPELVSSLIFQNVKLCLLVVSVQGKTLLRYNPKCSPYLNNNKFKKATHI